MALNAVMLNHTSNKPVPLPEEKRFLEIEGVETVLHALSNATALDSQTKALKANGAVYVTSHRVVFVSSAPPSSLAAESTSELVSLSCNLSHFQHGRLVQPWLAGKSTLLSRLVVKLIGADIIDPLCDTLSFRLIPTPTANYYEAVVLPQAGGRLSRPHSLKIHFLNGRAYEFYEALEEAKRRYEETRGRGSTAEEPLRKPHFARRSRSSCSLARSPALYQAGPSAQATAATSLSAEDVAAANCARQAERAEAHGDVQRAAGDPSDTSLPPAYGGQGTRS